MTVEKLVIAVVENNSLFSAATKKHENHSEAIDFTVYGSFLKEAHEKQKKKRKQYNLNSVSFLLVLHLTTGLINHL